MFFSLLPSSPSPPFPFSAQQQHLIVAQVATSHHIRSEASIDSPPLLLLLSLQQQMFLLTSQLGRLYLTSDGESNFAASVDKGRRGKERERERRERERERERGLGKVLSSVALIGCWQCLHKFFVVVTSKFSGLGLIENCLLFAENTYKKLKNVVLF